jgi:hypothetical protein
MLKGLNTRRLYKSFGVKRVNQKYMLWVFTQRDRSVSQYTAEVEFRTVE